MPRQSRPATERRRNVTIQTQHHQLQGRPQQLYDVTLPFLLTFRPLPLNGDRGRYNPGKIVRIKDARM